MTDDPAQLGNTESTADANLEKSLEDLTVAQLLGLLIRKPMATKRRFQPAAAAPALLSEAATSPPSSTQAAGLAGAWQRRAGRL